MCVWSKELGSFDSVRITFVHGCIFKTVLRGGGGGGGVFTASSDSGSPYETGSSTSSLAGWIDGQFRSVSPHSSVQLGTEQALR